MTTKQLNYKSLPVIAADNGATSPALTANDKGAMAWSTTTNKPMSWDGTKWNLLTKVDSVAGRTGDVTVTKADVGLGSVDNVAAASLRDRTTHTGEQAISSITGLQTALDGKAATGHSHAEATTSAAGFMSSADKAKLDGIVTANLVNRANHTGEQAISTITGLQAAIDGRASSGHSHSEATTSAGGFMSRTDKAKLDALNSATLLDRANHTGAQAINTVTGLQGALDTKASTGHTHSNATTTVAGFMSADDKTKLDGIAAGATAYTHPASHPASIITQDASNRFVTDAEKTTWNAKLGSVKTINGQSIVGTGDLAITASSTFNSDLTVNGIRIGVGANSGLWTNCVMGKDAMGKVTNGQDNAVVGRNAMQENTTGYANVAMGSYALNLNNTGYYNTAVGMSSLQQNTTGWNNVAFGLSALYNNISGYCNTAVGFRALYNSRTSYRNTAIGEQSLYSYTNADGYNNIAVGSNAMWGCTDGNHNIGIGDYALGNNRVDYNLAIGGQALMFNRNGTSNIAIGDRALRLNNGNNNVAIGTSALFMATTAYGISNSSIQILNAGSGYTDGTHTNINVIVKNSPTGVKINQEPIVTVTVVNGQITNLQNDSGFNGLGGPLDIDTIYTIRNSGTIGFNGAGFEFKYTQMAKAQNNVAIGPMAGSGLRLGSGNIIIGSMNNNSSYLPIYDCVGSDSNRIAMGHKSVTNAYIQVPWTVVSDARDKTNFASIPHGLDFVKQLKPTSYQFKVSRDSDKTNGGVRYGFKAQDIAAIEPEGIIVDTSDKDLLRYNESNLIPVLVKAIQELSAEVERLKNAIANP